MPRTFVPLSQPVRLERGESGRRSAAAALHGARHVAIVLVALGLVSIHLWARSPELTGHPRQSLSHGEFEHADRPQPGTYQAVPVDRGFAHVPQRQIAEPGSRLVIGCLGDANREYQVRLRQVNLSGSDADLSSSTRLASNSGTHPQPLPAGTIRPRVGEPLSTGDAAQSRDESQPDACRVFDFPTRLTAAQDPRNYVRILGELVATGQGVQVYRETGTGEEAGNGTSADDVAGILAEDLLPRFEERLGNCSDVDENGAVCVLITPRLADLSGGSEPISGFVRISDLDPGLAPPFSNFGEIIYLSSELTDRARLRAILAHEYAHLVCAVLARQGVSANGQGSPANSDQEEWLQEGLAHLAEREISGEWGNLEHRVRAFLEHPERSPLVTAAGAGTTRWREAGSRGAAYLFMQYCQDQSGGDFLRRAAGDSGKGRDVISRTMGQSFEQVFRQWSVDLAAGERAWLSDQAVVESLPQRTPAIPLAQRSVSLPESARGDVTFTVRGSSWICLEFAGSTATAAVDVRGSRPELGAPRRVVQIEMTPTADWQVTVVHP